MTATITSTMDARGRLVLSTPLFQTSGASSIRWSKSPNGTDWYVAGTSGLSAYTDNRPQRNHKSSTSGMGSRTLGTPSSTTTYTFSFTGVEFALIGDPVAGLVFNVTIDGVAQDPVKIDNTAADHGGGSGQVRESNQILTSMILYGKSGLSYGLHNVSVVVSQTAGSYGLPVNLRNFSYSEITIPFGSAVYYRAEALDASQNVLATDYSPAFHPRPDRLQSAKIASDALYSYWSFAKNTLGAINMAMLIPSIAGAYLMTKESRWITVMAEADAKMAGYPAALDDYEEMVVWARAGGAYYNAYQAFGNIAWLHKAEEWALYFLDNWGTVNNPFGCGINGVWMWSARGGSTPCYIPNQWTAPAFSVALVLADPASRFNDSADTTYYPRRAAMQTMMLANAEFGVYCQVHAFTNSKFSGKMPTTGEMVYSVRGSNLNVGVSDGTYGTTDSVYALFEWQHIKFISDKFNWRTAEVQKAAEWLSKKPITYPASGPYPDSDLSEPAFYASEYYWRHELWALLILVQAFYTAHGYVPSEFVDLLYSSSMDSSTAWPADNYSPAGFAPSGQRYDDYSALSHPDMFWTAANVAAIGNVPINTWFVEAPTDNAAPTINSFVMPSTATSLTVAVTAFSASDNVGVTGFLITESSTPPTSGFILWSSTAPSSFTFSAPGTRTAYAWVKDAAGNVSAYSSAITTITLPAADTTLPSVSSFLLGNVTGLTVAVSAFTGSDNVGVAGFLITESATPPAASLSSWLSYAPPSYLTGTYGTKTLYPWVKDAAGNVSAVFSSPRQVVFATPNQPPAFVSQPSVQSTTSVGGLIAYGTSDAEGDPYKIEVSTDGGSTWTVAVANEAPGTGKTLALFGLTAGTYTVRLRITALTGATTPVTSNAVQLVVAPLPSGNSGLARVLENGGWNDYTMKMRVRGQWLTIGAVKMKDEDGVWH